LLEEFLAAATSGKIDLDADGKWTVEAWRICAEQAAERSAGADRKLDWITKHFCWIRS
jgi:hypothetical protein